MSSQYGWAKGTGFGYADNGAGYGGAGYGGDGFWDPATWSEKQKIKDNELKSTCEALTKKLSPPPNLSEDTIKEIKKSCLPRFICEYLQNDSFLDMEQHELVYKSIFELCGCLSQKPQLSDFFHASRNGKTLLDLLESHKKQADLVQKLVIEAKNAGTSKIEECEHAQSFSGAVIGSVDKVKENLAHSENIGENIGEKNDEHNSDNEDLSEVYIDAVKKHLDTLSELTGLKAYKNGFADEKITRKKKKGKKKEIAEEEKQKVEKKGALGRLKRWFFGNEKEPKGTPNQNYLSIMTPFRFEVVENFPYHHYSSKAEFKPRGKWMKRIAHEYSDLSNSSPVSHDSSVFIRVSEQQMCLARFLITGPSDTPYAHGCFLFDVFFPSSYPNEPPQVNLQTTGGGSVRFNPNLYEDGMVCLSLLGTWQGDGGGESWGVHSTLLQVLVSLQSLIFVPEPYYNEPGYESEIGTASGKSSSEYYNKNIHNGTLNFAILEMIKNPPQEFKEVVEKHFVLRKKEILQTAKQWSTKNSDLSSVVSQVKSELEKLEKRHAKTKKIRDQNIEKSSQQEEQKVHDDAELVGGESNDGEEEVGKEEVGKEEVGKEEVRKEEVGKDEQEKDVLENDMNNVKVEQKKENGDGEEIKNRESSA